MQLFVIAVSSVIPIYFDFFKGFVSKKSLGQEITHKIRKVRSTTTSVSEKGFRFDIVIGTDIDNDYS